jgi:hypothetical protein
VREAASVSLLASFAFVSDSVAVRPSMSIDVYLRLSVNAFVSVRVSTRGRPSLSRNITSCSPSCALSACLNSYASLQPTGSLSLSRVLFHDHAALTLRLRLPSIV